MDKTVKVKEETWKVLSKMKIDHGLRTVGEVIDQLVEKYGDKAK